jgi:inner membrane protein
MIDAIVQVGPWAWIIAGLLLMLVELAAPGLFFIWLGLAALATGLIVAVAGLGWSGAAMVFAAAAVGAVLLGRAVTRSRWSEPDSAVHLNTLARDLIGKTVRLDQPIEAGQGRVRIGDTVWRVQGEDSPAATPVRIVGLEGTVLVVERVKS